ncbi:hypothetical protein PHYSODRAFT_298026 [Phytophthora sojae]|uniref:Uncharacterized protein n=1 Tax=Phytophthora sojae (strain P6497) TaxID=1094619 RepID=G4Z524_PHYSP|nr:hypothetical protein PHYSODRAFT_298026 [Phytophthora sojae]EGZ19470.1 hypothetical protein PHYSODRAFT_298026 [Phytophthora sojae]|eukprot:XP_009522187.1 hypothetical protein PHYSODRAFT_298026 [Phytophthora sojae]
MTKISHIEFWDMDRPPLRYGGDCAKFTLKKLEDVYKWEILNDQRAEHNRFINNLLGDMATDDETFDVEESELNYADMLNGLDASNNRSPQPLNDREITYYYRRPRTEQRCCEEGQAVIADDFKFELGIN